MLIPAHTTAMVNMWAITHDPHVCAITLSSSGPRGSWRRMWTSVDVTSGWHRSVLVGGSALGRTWG
ncbi:hypothetical protein LINPERHAP1_LOCUS26857 [Linum perenne]